MFMKSEEIQKLREKYPKGTKLRLISMDDSQAPPKGTVGVVNYIDDAGNIHMNWEDGSSLALISGVDSFEIIKKKN